MEVRKYVRIILNIVIPVITVLVICFFVPKVLAFFLPFVICLLYTSDAADE